MGDNSMTESFTEATKTDSTINPHFVSRTVEQIWFKEFVTHLQDDWVRKNAGYKGFARKIS